MSFPSEGNSLALRAPFVPGALRKSRSKSLAPNHPTGSPNVTGPPKMFACRSYHPNSTMTTNENVVLPADLRSE